jgi:diacylglycerol kinase family enzyme
VHEVVNGIMTADLDRRPRLGVVPLGSGNDFAGGVGIPPEPPLALRRIFQDAHIKPLDCGSIRDATGRMEYWCNVAGIGFDAAINIQSRSIPWLHGFWMYLGATLRTIILKNERPHLSIDIEGASRRAGS